MRRFTSLLLLPIALFLLVTPAHATQSTLITATSHCCVSNTLVEQHTAGGNMFVTYSQVLTETGDVQGTVNQTFTFIIHTSGELEVHGKGLFTGTVLGSQPGTAEVSFVATGTISPFATSGHFVIENGTGGLAGIHGEGTGGNFDPAHPELGTLSILVHFDPA